MATLIERINEEMVAQADRDIAAIDQRIAQLDKAANTYNAAKRKLLADRDALSRGVPVMPSRKIASRLDIHA